MPLIIHSSWNNASPRVLPKSQGRLFEVFLKNQDKSKEKTVLSKNSGFIIIFNNLASSLTSFVTLK